MTQWKAVISHTDTQSPFITKALEMKPKPHMYTCHRIKQCHIHKYQILITATDITTDNCGQSPWSYPSSAPKIDPFELSQSPLFTSDHCLNSSTWLQSPLPEGCRDLNPRCKAAFDLDCVLQHVVVSVTAQHTLVFVKMDMYRQRINTANIKLISEYNQGTSWKKNMHIRYQRQTNV